MNTQLLEQVFIAWLKLNPSPNEKLAGTFQSSVSAFINNLSVEAEENIEYYNEKHRKFLKTYDQVEVINPENLYKRKYDVNINKSHIKYWIEFMNKKRGFDIRQYVLELSKF